MKLKLIPPFVQFVCRYPSEALTSPCMTTFLPPWLPWDRTTVWFWNNKHGRMQLPVLYVVLRVINSSLRFSVKKNSTLRFLHGLYVCNICDEHGNYPFDSRIINELGKIVTYCFAWNINLGCVWMMEVVIRVLQFSSTSSLWSGREVDIFSTNKETKELQLPLLVPGHALIPYSL